MVVQLELVVVMGVVLAVPVVVVVVVVGPVVWCVLAVAVVGRQVCSPVGLRT